jgi:5-methylcytosine-specific restriction endonuclease McrA
MKPCLACGEPSEGSRCDEHRAEQENARESRRNVEHPAYGNRTRWKNASRRARAAQPWCLDCGATSNLSVDHIIPFRERPDLAYAQDNLAIRCRPCNARKGDTMPDAATVAAVEAAVAARRARRTRGETPDPSASRCAGEAESPLHTPGGYR